MEDGIISGIIRAIINPNFIYENMSFFTGLSTSGAFFIIFFITLRVLIESQNSISGKANFVEAFSASFKSLNWFFIYSASGLFIFGAAYSMSEFYSHIGTIDIVNRELYDLHADINITEKEAVSWYNIVFESLVDAGSLPFTAIMYLLFNVMGFFYQLANALIDFMFAITLTLIYAYGFIAIPSAALSDDYSLVKGFIKNIIAIFLWLIIESILLIFAYIVVSVGGKDAMSSYNDFGHGFTAMTVWYFGASLTMVLIIILRVLAPFIAFFLSNNQAITSATGAPAALLAAKMGNEALNSMKQGEGSLGSSMMPNSEGDRLRDKVMQNISDVSSSTPGEAGRRIASAASGLAATVANAFSGSGVEPSSGSQGVSSPDQGSDVSQSNSNGSDTSQNQQPGSGSDVSSNQNNTSSGSDPVNPDQSSNVNNISDHQTSSSENIGSSDTSQNDQTSSSEHQQNSSSHSSSDNMTHDDGSNSNQTHSGSSSADQQTSEQPGSDKPESDQTGQTDTTTQPSVEDVSTPVENTPSSNIESDDGSQPSPNNPSSSSFDHQDVSSEKPKT